MRIVIVGGVAGGMSCAARARRLSETAEIIVLERSLYVSYANCGLPYYVGGEITDPASLLVQTPEALRESLNLDVRIGHEVTGLDPATRTLHIQSPTGSTTLTYDALVLSPGATPVRPPIPGLDSPRVKTLRTVPDALTMRENLESGLRQAVVIGAGFIGLEVAEALQEAGVDTTVVELAPHVLPPLEPDIANVVTRELQRLGVRVHTGVSAQEIRHTGTNSSDTVVLSDGTTLSADLIVLSAGVRPDTEPFTQAGLAHERGVLLVDEYGQTSHPDIWAVGDAVMSVDAVTQALRHVPLAGPANRGGRLIADRILEPETARAQPPALGTAIVRMGELTAAITGANSQTLTAAEIPFETFRLHPLQHAGYFPGAQQLHLLVHAHAETGRLLGAQAVGPAGIDKRIDVLATAIRNEMVIPDLMDLDLAYSPPYGSAKDPVNLVGMMGENFLTGHLRQWQPTQLAEVQRDAFLLDVRSPVEFAAGHLPGSINIAHTQIREQLAQIRELADGRPVRILCASGMRSYLAHRILTAAGFDSATLSGGMLSLRASNPHLELAY